MTPVHTRIALAALLGLIPLTTVHAGEEPHGGDILLSVERGAIVTGLIDEKAGTIDSPAYVFPAEFGDGGNPTFTSNPGFDSPPGTFPVGTRVGWNALAGTSVWTGRGFADAPGEFITVSFTAALQVIVQDEPVDGFDLAVQAGGAWHYHLTFELARLDATPPTPGIYLLELEMYSTDPSIESSQPFWIVFNYADEANHDAAIEWTRDNLAPPPVCMGDLVSSDTFQPPPDGTVDGADLAFVLGEWGRNQGSPADLVDSDTFEPPPDGLVDGADLAVLLGAWGACR